MIFFFHLFLHPCLSLMSQFALFKVGALKAVFPFYYKIVCLQFDQIDVLFGAGVGT